MTPGSGLLKKEEQVRFALRGLYRRYGYSCFKMSKFEAYDLYVRNKDFLVSEGVITFTDTNGRLMALKPDVTLSIVKNAREEEGTVQRLYYDENVYRVSERTRAYKEIAQAGLECIGDVGLLELCEVIALAGESLRLISPDCVLALSHLGAVSALLERPELAPARKELLACVGERGAHQIGALCARCGAPEGVAERLEALIAAYGPAEQALPPLMALEWEPAAARALAELAEVAALLKKIWGLEPFLDFSLVGGMSYYNGLAFRGFVRGIPAAVLRGGQYDDLMRRMGKSSRAVGFAVYLDQLERMEEERDLDADVLLLYGPEDPVEDVLRRAEELRGAGKRVAVQREAPEGLRCGQTLRFTPDGEGGERHG